MHSVDLICKKYKLNQKYQLCQKQYNMLHLLKIFTQHLFAGLKVSENTLGSDEALWLTQGRRYKGSSAKIVNGRANRNIKKLA